MSKLVSIQKFLENNYNERQIRDFARLASGCVDKGCYSTTYDKANEQSFDSLVESFFVVFKSSPDSEGFVTSLKPCDFDDDSWEDTQKTHYIHASDDYDDNFNFTNFVDSILNLENYPILDEDLHSQIEHDAQHEYWDDYGRDDLIREIMKPHGDNMILVSTDATKCLNEIIDAKFFEFVGEHTPGDWCVEESDGGFYIADSYFEDGAKYFRDNWELISLQVFEDGWSSVKDAAENLIEVEKQVEASNDIYGYTNHSLRRDLENARSALQDIVND